MKTPFIKKLLAGVILLFLFTPLLQHNLGLVKERKLGGVNPPARYLAPSIGGYWRGEFQAAHNKYLKENFGFHNTLVRLNHQINFDLFDKAKANSVVMGKDDFLYDMEYIDSYMGDSFIGEEEVQIRVEKLKTVRDSLLQYGVDLVIVVAPGKGTYHPEFIADQYTQKPRKRTNYEAFSEAFLENNFHYLDFNGWMIGLKESTPYPLYGKAGIHWSRYASYLAADSISRFLGELRQVEMPQYVLDSIIVTEQNQFNDNDISHGLNILFEAPTFPMAYPQYHIEADSNLRRLEVMTIGDSYYWELRDVGLDEQVYNKGQFWFYGKEIHEQDKKTRSFLVMDWKEELIRKDVVLLLFTETRLDRFDFDFSAQSVQAFADPAAFQDKLREEHIQKYIRSINENVDWLNVMKEKAVTQGKTLEEVVRNDAIYLVKEKKNLTNY